MSTEQIIRQLDRIEQMLASQLLPVREVMNSMEAAQYVGLSRKYLYELISLGKLQAYKPNDGRLYFKKADLYQWMLSKPKKALAATVQAVTAAQEERG